MIEEALLQTFFISYSVILFGWFRYRWIMHGQFISVREYKINSAREQYKRHLLRTKLLREETEQSSRRTHEAMGELHELGEEYGIDVYR